MQLNPDDAAAVANLRQKVGVIEARLRAAINKRLQDPRQTYRTCYKTIEVGNADFAQVYGSVWGTIVSADPEGLQMYRDAYAALTFPAKGAKQPTSDPVELYRASARILPIFRAAMEEGPSDVSCPPAQAEPSPTSTCAQEAPLPARPP